MSHLCVILLHDAKFLLLSFILNIIIFVAAAVAIDCMPIKTVLEITVFTVPTKSSSQYVLHRLSSKEVSFKR